MRKEQNIPENEKIIVFLGVDEFKKVYEFDNLRHKICQQMDTFYREIAKHNTFLRIGFTSFLPEDVMDVTNSGRPIVFVHLTPLPLDVVSKLFKKYIDKREANKAAIMMCLGHQRALALLFAEFTKNPTSEVQTTAKLREEGAAAIAERGHFKNITNAIAKILHKYVPGNLSWIELEPAIMGRKVSIEGEEGKIYKRAVANGFYNNPISDTQTSIFPRCPL